MNKNFKQVIICLLKQLVIIVSGIFKYSHVLSILNTLAFLVIALEIPRKTKKTNDKLLKFK